MEQRAIGMALVLLGLLTSGGCALAERINPFNNPTDTETVSPTISPDADGATIEPIDPNGENGEQPNGEQAQQRPFTVSPDPRNQLPLIDDIILGTGNRSQIGLPQGWQATNALHDTAEIQILHPDKQLYAIALGDPKTTQDRPTLADQAVAYLQQLLEGPNALATVMMTDVDQVSGYPAVQYQIQGQFQGVPITYLHTTISGPSAYYQVLTWTLTSRFDTYEDELQQVIQSFEPR